MKGWILLEEGIEVITSDNALQVFKTKKDLFEHYGEGLGECNSIKKVAVCEDTITKKRTGGN